MGREGALERIDPSLVARVAALSPAGQRWLKTALHAVNTTADLPAARGEPPRASPGRRAPNLEDVISGKADLREHLESYPELVEELEGLADIIDMLRDAGEKRRKRGEQILREEILGDGPGGRRSAPEDEEPLF